MEVYALFDYLLYMLTMKCHPESNRMMGDPKSNEKTYGLSKTLPPCTVGFTVPPSDELKPPDPHYQVLEG